MKKKKKKFLFLVQPYLFLNNALTFEIGFSVKLKDLGISIRGYWVLYAAARAKCLGFDSQVVQKKNFRGWFFLRDPVLT